MKDKLRKLAEDYTVSSEAGQALYDELCVLFGVSCLLQPLTIDNVNKMLKRVATDTWIAAKGTDKGFKDWYAERCKLNLNS